MLIHVKRVISCVDIWGIDAPSWSTGTCACDGIMNVACLVESSQHKVYTEWEYHNYSSGIVK
jgi:hypothetical protein